MLNLFSVGGVNYSAFIVRDSYNVNKVEEFNEWTDANFIKHRYAARQKVKGEFDMQFMKRSDYSAFVANLANTRGLDGTYIATLFLNNQDTAESINCFISFEAGLTQDSNFLLRIPKFTVKVEQQ